MALDNFFPSLSFYSCKRDLIIAPLFLPPRAHHTRAPGVLAAVIIMVAVDAARVLWQWQVPAL